MTQKTRKQTKKSVIPGVIGAGVATLAAGVAGAYFLQSAKNRKKLKGWIQGQLPHHQLNRLVNL